MRNLICVIVIVLLFVGGSVFFDCYINTLADDMLDLVDGLETKEDIEALTAEWNKRSTVAELVIDHGEVDILNQYLWAMSVQIDADYDEYVESKKLAKESFRHIRERNTIGLENIL